MSVFFSELFIYLSYMLRVFFKVNNILSQDSLKIISQMINSNRVELLKVKLNESETQSLQTMK